jgi:hypothetical protein
MVLMLALDSTLYKPDTITKYKTAAQISEKVLAEVSKLCVAGSKIVDICEKGDKLIEEELAKVYRGKKITKGTCRAAGPLLRPRLTMADRPCSRLRPPHHCLPCRFRHPLHAA